MGIPDHDSRVLIVDDEPHVCQIMARWLDAEGYECVLADSGERACRELETGDFALVVCDIMMPGMSGIDLLATANEKFRGVAFIMVTAVGDTDTAIRALELGAFGYVIKPLDRSELIINVVNALERRRLLHLSRRYEDQLEAEVRQRTAEVYEREVEIIMRLISASEYRDDETGAHIRRIGLLGAVLAEEAGWEAPAVEQIRLAGPMHDIGKVGIPDAVLLKPGKLTPEEFEVVKTHSEIGARILGGSDIPLLAMAGGIAFSHHEKWDGSGYPRAIAGEAIPESARIIAVVDVYDALMSDRVYRPAFPEDEAIAIMTREQGTHFDPDLFERFLRVLPEFHEILGVVESVISLSPSPVATSIGEDE